MPITAMFVAFFALGLIALSVPITLRRVHLGVLIGEGDDTQLRRRIRAQANFTEYVPIALIAMALAEAGGAAAAVVLSIGASLLVGRVLHAVGMWRDQPVLRGLGLLLTIASLLAASAQLLYSAVAT